MQLPRAKLPRHKERISRMFQQEIKLKVQAKEVNVYQLIPFSTPQISSNEIETFDQNLDHLHL